MDEDDEGKGLEDLLDLVAGLKTKEDLHLEKPGDVERLADIIHAAIIKLHGMKKRLGAEPIDLESSASPPLPHPHAPWKSKKKELWRGKNI
jgi:hypothetical protein